MIEEAHEAQSGQASPRGFLHVKGGEGKEGRTKKLKNYVPHIVVLTKGLVRPIQLQCPHHREIKSTSFNLTPVLDSRTSLFLPIPQLRSPSALITKMAAKSFKLLCLENPLLDIQGQGLVPCFYH